MRMAAWSADKCGLAAARGLPTMAMATVAGAGGGELGDRFGLHPDTPGANSLHPTFAPCTAARHVPAALFRGFYSVLRTHPCNVSRRHLVPLVLLASGFGPVDRRHIALHSLFTVVAARGD